MLQHSDNGSGNRSRTRHTAAAIYVMISLPQSFVRSYEHKPAVFRYSKTQRLYNGCRLAFIVYKETSISF